jgi:hypothetical protein
MWAREGGGEGKVEVGAGRMFGCSDCDLRTRSPTCFEAKCARENGWMSAEKGVEEMELT